MSQNYTITPIAQINNQNIAIQDNWRHNNK